MKSFFVAASLFFAVSSASAKSLVLVLNDSTNVYFLLSDMPVMKVEDGKLTVKDRTFEFDDVDRFYISETDDPNGIEHVLAKRGIDYSGSTIVIGSECEVGIFATDGKKMKATTKRGEGFTSVDIATLPVGTYLLRVGKEVFKFMKR